jgi:hypothetical protein
MSNLVLVLQVSNHLGLSRQDPFQASSVWGWDFFGWTDSNLSLVNTTGRLLHNFNHELDEWIANDGRVFLSFVTKLKGIIEEDVS